MKKIPTIEYLKDGDKIIQKSVNEMEIDPKGLVLNAKQILLMLADTHKSIKQGEANVKEWGETYKRTKKMLDEIDKEFKTGTIPTIKDFNNPENFPEILTEEEKEDMMKKDKE